MEFSMYAIIKTGGKQYRVENGLKLKIEQVPADVGSELVIDQVLMIADGDNVSMGKPLVMAPQSRPRCWNRAGMTRCASSKCAGVNTIRNTRDTGRITPKFKSPAFRPRRICHGT